MTSISQFILQNFLGENNAYLQSSQRHYTMYESPEIIFIHMDVPGINEDSITVDFYNNRVVVKGKRNVPTENDAERSIVKYSDVIYGEFEKKITLSSYVTSNENVEVSVNNGVLTIKINKANEDRNRFVVRVNQQNNNTTTSSSQSEE